MSCNITVISPLSPNIVYRMICPINVAIVCPFSIAHSAQKYLHQEKRIFYESTYDPFYIKCFIPQL